MTIVRVYGLIPPMKKGEKVSEELKRHTYTLNFSGTMYYEADSEEEAYEMMAEVLRENASDYEIEVLP